MIREIVIAPDERLNTVAANVDPELQSIAQIAEDLVDTLLSFDGAHGIAAVQIGEMVQMFAIVRDGWVCVYANPKIVATSGSTKTREGCLSLPGIMGRVKRPRKV